MQTIIRTLNHQEITLEVPPPSSVPSFFVFALYKSGSLMLDHILEDICSHLQIPLISVAKAAFSQGVDEELLSKDVCKLFVEVGYGFYGSRHLPSYLNGFDLSQFKKILLIRDPRDILVSHYFSIKKSHLIPSGKLGGEMAKNREKLQDTDVNEYAIEKAPVFGNIMRRFGEIEGSLFQLFRYEDVVFNKRQWVQDILDFLNFKLEDNKIQEIVSKYDVFPDQENPSAHIRQVTPGDYKRKLNPETIEFLNQHLKDVLVKYGYPID